MKRLTILLGVAILSSSTLSFATTAINWDQLVKACTSPNGLPNQQIKPVDLKVTCTDTRYEWVQVQLGVGLPRARNIMASVASTKYNVGSVVGNIPTEDQLGQCLDYRQVELKSTHPEDVTCDQILNPNNGKNGVEFCEKIMDRQYENNPDGYEKRETGKTANICVGGGSGK